ncbi:copper chaperone PCu(A)C [Saccharobesus litoralis]|uniref:copper chaperone PCu(A)C n=1 Tax=Saccharobesus litoralis TaxID=2172099 RepID=UPI00131EE7AD|nr:copper chaperone PCu(A)C [Saccharobesus litoralis]
MKSLFLYPLLKAFGCCLALVSSLAWANLTFENAHVRLLPPNVKNTAAFVSITNTGQEGICLVKAWGDKSQTVEFHDHIMQNDMMKMVHVPRVHIAAGETVTLQSGSLHLMLLNLTEKLKLGDSVTFTLEDDTEKRYTFSATVEKVQSSVSHGHKHHHH